MSRGFFLLRFILTLFIVGILVVGGVLLYHSGYVNGYNTAVLAANASGKSVTAPLPYAGYGAIWPAFGYPFFFPPFGFFFAIGGLFLTLFLVSSLFRLWGWRRWGGMGQGHRPYWFREWEEQHQTQSEKGPGGPKPETH